MELLTKKGRLLAMSAKTKSDKRTSLQWFVVIYYCNEFYSTDPCANVIKHVTPVIYCHSMVIPSFCAVKLYNFLNYCGMAVNYHNKKFNNIGQW